MEAARDGTRSSSAGEWRVAFEGWCDVWAQLVLAVLLLSLERWSSLLSGFDLSDLLFSLSEGRAWSGLSGLDCSCLFRFLYHRSWLSSTVLPFSNL